MMIRTTMESHEILDYNVENRNTPKEEIVSLTQFCVLTIFSFGFYELWWVYKAWRFFKEKDKLDIMPAARAVFSIIFLISLFNKILKYARDKGYKKSYSSVGLFLAILCFNITSRLPDPFWLISMFSLLFFIPPFKALNYARLNSEEFRASYQQSFNGRQIGLLVVGILLWLLVLVGMISESELQ